jgi:hypothetical protein
MEWHLELFLPLLWFIRRHRSNAGQHAQTVDIDMCGKRDSHRVKFLTSP